MELFAEILNLKEDVMDAGRLVDRYFQVPELVVAVPKIILDDIPTRTSVPEPQTAEQLVEVQTIVSCSSLKQRSAEQTVDIPVPRLGFSGGLQGLQKTMTEFNSTVEVFKIFVPVRDQQRLPQFSQESRF